MLFFWLFKEHHPDWCFCTKMFFISTCTSYYCKKEPLSVVTLLVQRNYAFTALSRVCQALCLLWQRPVLPSLIAFYRRLNYNEVFGFWIRGGSFLSSLTFQTVAFLLVSEVSHLVTRDRKCCKFCFPVGRYKP